MFRERSEPRVCRRYQHGDRECVAGICVAIPITWSR